MDLGNLIFEILMGASVVAFVIAIGAAIIGVRGGKVSDSVAKKAAAISLINIKL